jgi:predicted nucleotidyltransferase
LDNSHQHIIRPLAYFDIFHYPLTKEELQSYSGLSPTELDRALVELVQHQQIFVLAEFYALENNMQLAHGRRKANALAAQRMKVAAKAAAIIARFPYVQAVAVSGSLSKNFADAKTDIDFFVITTANRLWLARTFLHLLKKISFVTGSQHLFCMNYFVDTEAMEIVEKNIFTATEIVTLIPMHGPDILQQFMQANQWTRWHFPKPIDTAVMAKPAKKGWLARWVQHCLNGQWGNRLDDRLLRITQQRWQKKADRNQLNSRGIKMGMVADKHFSKPDPANFQQKVVRQFEERIAQFSNKVQIPMN